MTPSTNRESAWGRLNLCTKFIGLVTLILILTQALIIMASIHIQNGIYRDQLLEEGRIFGSFLSQASHEAILAYDIVTLNTYVQEASSRPYLYYAAILDSKGDSLTSYIDKDNTGIKKAISAIDSEKPLLVIGHMQKGRDVIHQEYPITFNQKQIGTVLIGLSTQGLMLRARETLLYLVVANGFVICFLALAIYLVFRRQAMQPISNLISGAKRLAKGDFSRPVEVFSHDELGSLTMAFNSMMKLIAKKHNHLIMAQRALEKHQLQLEKIVQKRTKELQTTNEELSEEIEERRQLATSLFEEKQLLEKTQDKLRGAYAELKQTQSQMLQREKMASAGQLAAGVAHEINNPIGFISSNLNSLQKYLDKIIAYNTTQQETLARLASAETLAALAAARKKLKIDFILEDCPDLLAESLDGTDRIQKIVQNMKTFSRMDEAKYQKADLNEGLKSTLNLVWNEIKYKATVTKEYGDIPLTFCYPHELNQVFMNLLVNAAQAIDQKGDIKVITRQADNTIVIQISDTGCGMSEETQRRIFEPFFTTKDVGQGTGLGLSIAYDIIKKHGGNIVIESLVGQGTTFTISLPIVETAVELNQISGKRGPS